MQTRRKRIVRNDRSRSDSFISSFDVNKIAIASPTIASIKKRARRQCSRPNCIKVDAGGGFCVAHGGGKKCSFPGCTKGYQTGGFCRQHGGGARCQVDGCTKVDAGRGLCRAHGGGKRCQIADCPKADVGGGFCTAHGGGRRCSAQGCLKIDQGGGKCRAHGGARRCRRRSCQQPARGATGFCTEHGGARVCSVLHCRRLVRSPIDTGSICAACTRSQKQTAERPMRNSFAFYRNESTESSRLSDPSTSEDADASVLASLSPMSPSSANLRCNGSQVANCLDNGCARSFGGDCNCVASCTCNSPTLPSTPSMVPILTSSLTLTRTRPTISDFEPRSQCAGSTMPSATVIKRFLLQVTLCSSLMGIEAIKALLSTMPGVRSVHLTTEASLQTRETSFQPPFADFKSESRKDAALCRSMENSAQLVAVRGDHKIDLEAAMAFLRNLQIAKIDVVEESTTSWTRKEVVLRVPDMMCPLNCGSAVLNAVHALEGVEAARLNFQDRQIVVRGDMLIDGIQSAISDIGFDSDVNAETSLPRRFRFRVDDLSDVGFNGVKLKNALYVVEGVENIVLLTDRVEVLVVAMLLDSGPLIKAAERVGFKMLELSEEAWGIPMEIAPPALGTIDDTESNSSSEIYQLHKCDMRTCPQNGCSRYMTTVAHTAALAVGWAVPGCGMSFGGECTCGDNCKCAGCPEHNPAPLNI
ncbi:hypothetical protein CCR75_004578 [Bremia lactucae]|uniref:HMA domain-containing protein n=1 Tax=Bremia lactucae TaxID=4779 RepID=A0A976IE30_BRELC|nr:hypothetical protein CCR75_004578 [Bremia lactucae]